MTHRLVSRLPKFVLAAAGAGALLLADAARPTQTVDAASWQEVWSNIGVYCEGCCTLSFCCNISSPCRVWQDQN